MQEFIKQIIQIRLQAERLEAPLTGLDDINHIVNYYPVRKLMLQSM